MGEIRDHDDIVARAACVPAVIDDVMNVQRLSAEAAGRPLASASEMIAAGTIHQREADAIDAR
jgi:hypothetical protein